MIRHMIALASPEWEPVPYTGKNGLYCAVQPDDASKFRLIRLCEELGVTTDHRKLHCTLMYSKNDAPEDDHIRDIEGTRPRGRINYVEYWEGHNNKGYLVAKLVSEDVQLAHERLVRAGARHSYSPYNPHITLVSDLPATEGLKANIDRVNELLAQESISINFSNLTLSDIKQD